LPDLLHMLATKPAALCSKYVGLHVRKEPLVLWAAVWCNCSASVSIDLRVAHKSIIISVTLYVILIFYLIIYCYTVVSSTL